MAAEEISEVQKTITCSRRFEIFLHYESCKIFRLH